MEVKVMPINKGETFCCSMKSAKDIFQDTDVCLNFAYTGRNYGTFAETPDKYYCKKNVHGRVIASMSMYSRDQRALMSFYVIKEKNFNAELKKEFEQKFLPEFLKLYNELLNDQSLIAIQKLMLVELLDGKLILHRANL